MLLSLTTRCRSAIIFSHCFLKYWAVSVCLGLWSCTVRHICDNKWEEDLTVESNFSSCSITASSGGFLTIPIPCCSHNTTFLYTYPAYCLDILQLLFRLNQLSLAKLLNVPEICIFIFHFTSNLQPFCQWYSSKVNQEEQTTETYLCSWALLQCRFT